MTPNDLILTEIADAIKTGEVTAVQALGSCLDAIGAHDGAVNATV